MEDDQPHRDMLIEHLPYEIGMMNRSFAFLVENRPEGLSALPPKDSVTLLFLRNTVIEAFWIHARALLEFFWLNAKDEGRVASARNFTTGFVDYDLPFATLADEINEQICHLQYKRHRDTEGKIGGYDMQRVKEALNRAAAKFEENLDKEAAKIWKKLPVQSIRVTPYNSATNDIGVISTASLIAPYSYVITGTEKSEPKADGE